MSAEMNNDMNAGPNPGGARRNDTQALHPGGARYWAPQAWIDGRWQERVLLETDARGYWSKIESGVDEGTRTAAIELKGAVLPGMVNAHSHAFQRAIAGLTGQRAGAASEGDDFWSWREKMYRAALRIGVAALEHVAALLYAELLRGGYTQVCEFHYVHGPVQGAIPGHEQSQPLDMSMALVRAARRTGMGLTLLPVLYMRAGFQAQELRPEQHRFGQTPERLMQLIADLQKLTAGDPQINLGVAIHSLRAVNAEALREIAGFAKQAQLPVHIHISEQTQEVQDCLSVHGARPIDWLASQVDLNEHWNLVHATHASAQELQKVRERGAAIVLCPATEADLGDGVFPYSEYGGLWSLGSDSHVCRSWAQELRHLEYAQRLVQRKRNVALLNSREDSCGSALLAGAHAGAQAATGLPLGRLASGCRADFLVLNAQAPALLGVPASQQLDALIFSSAEGYGAPTFKQTWVAGRCVVDQGESGAGLAGFDTLASQYTDAMHGIWGD